MMASKSSVRLGPVRARMPLSSPVRVRLRLLPRRRRPAGPGTLRGRFLAALAEGVGFDSACDCAGLKQADVLLARARDPRFAEAWDQVEEARRAAMEAMLLDRGAEDLRAPRVADGQGGLGLAKPTAAMLQWLLGPPRAPRPTRGPDAKGGAPMAPAAEAPLDEAEADAILERALAQLAAVEAALAKEGGDGGAA